MGQLPGCHDGSGGERVILCASTLKHKLTGDRLISSTVGGVRSFCPGISSESRCLTSGATSGGLPLSFVFPPHFNGLPRRGSACGIFVVFCYPPHLILHKAIVRKRTLILIMHSCFLQIKIQLFFFLWRNCEQNSTSFQSIDQKHKLTFYRIFKFE